MLRCFSFALAFTGVTAAAFPLSLLLSACGSRTGLLDSEEAAPSARDAGASNGSAIVFGGYDDTRGDVLGDAWAWNGTGWTQLDVSGPSARSNAAMASLGGVLFGGADVNGNSLADTWTWNGSAWTQLDATGHRRDSAL